MNRSPLTVAEFEDCLEVMGQPGDCVLFDYGKRGLVAWAIERCQRRMMHDLDAAIMPHDIQDAAKHTHAGMLTKGLQIIEMTTPRVRIANWNARLKHGDRVVIRRPVDENGDDISRQTGARAAIRSLLDFRKEYPHREILRYWLWSWGLKKLTLGQKFQKVFENPETDVCSDSCWRWWMEAAVWPDIDPDSPEASPAGHYPAELAINPRLRTVFSATINKGV